jgi:hypothetical protein
MELTTIEMDPHAARRAYLEYKRGLVSEAQKRLGQAERRYREVDAAAARGYKALAAGQRLLKLSETMAAGGTETRLTKTWNGGTEEVRMPRLACIRADASRVCTTGIDGDGAITFYAGRPNRWNDPVSRAKPNRVDLPDGTYPEGERTQGYRRTWHVAVVPTIPPALRPSRGLGGYHLLWEADWSEQVPVDPALLKRLGGDLYAVVAIWDLTELEQAVLAGA